MSKQLFLENVSSVLKISRRLIHKAYSHTVLLPKTSFPHRVTSSKREEWDHKIEKDAKFNSLYSWQESHNKGDLFVLHDGPPYANGDVHLGHFINKVLKDISVRFRVLQGQRVCLRPGWDCHGLPIEHKVLRSGEESLLSPIEIRKKARKFAEETLKSQKDSFLKWGLLADWDNPYTTYSSNYIIQQLKAFDICYQKGLVYQDYRPVYWSPVARTSLAEAELEYKDNHVSKSIYVEFLLTHTPDIIRSITGTQPVYLLIWTTTPWTLPSNQAVAFSGDNRYCVVRHNLSSNLWVVAGKMVETLKKALDCEITVLSEFEGWALKHCLYRHPIYPESLCEYPMLHGSHVTMEKGSGLVHTAPNHGFEDYQLAQSENLKLEECLVDEKGKLTPKAGVTLSGLDILSRECTDAISKCLGARMVHLEHYQHSHPYDWRTKTPVIIRASQQWFLDVQQIREQALKSLDEVSIHPEAAKTTMKMYIANRPHWCISRQRSWGVPIPVFYSNKTGKPITSSAIIHHLCNLIKEHGVDIWWSSTIKQLLPKTLLAESGFSPDEEYTAGKDIFDIWIDSGLSWKAVLPDGVSASDLCVEGKDQARGWFQSSLLTSIALQGKPPYKSLFVHGFAVDEKRQKMSKSIGNMVEPKTLLTGNKNQPGFGVDAVRLWVAQHDSFASDYCVTIKAIQKSAADMVKIRNFVKFILGNLSDFNFESDACSTHDMLWNDKYMLYYLQKYKDKVAEEYYSMKYSVFVRQHLDGFLNRLTSFYFESVKDRLYCDGKKSLSRRSCQTALLHILETLVRSLAPILPYMSEEAFLHHPIQEKRGGGVFRTTWKLPEGLDAILSENELNCFRIVEELHEAVSKASEPLNTSFSNVDLIIQGNEEFLQLLQLLQNEKESCTSELCAILRVATVRLVQVDQSNESSVLHRVPLSVSSMNKDFEIELLFTKPSQSQCERCRRCTAEENKTLCLRCYTVLLEMKMLPS